MIKLGELEKAFVAAIEQALQVDKSLEFRNFPAPPVSSLRIERLGGHDHIRLWTRGGLAGMLVLTEGDGPEIAMRLMIPSLDPNRHDRHKS